MKAALFVLVLALSLSSARAGQLFRKVAVLDDTWEVTFQPSGARYEISINQDTRGTSGYRQRLVLKRGEVLRLVDEHWNLLIEPSVTDGEPGIKITRSCRMRIAGEPETEVSFEPAHQETKR